MAATSLYDLAGHPPPHATGAPGCDGEVLVGVAGGGADSSSQLKRTATAGFDREAGNTGDAGAGHGGSTYSNVRSLEMAGDERPRRAVRNAKVREHANVAGAGVWHIDLGSASLSTSHAVQNMPACMASQPSIR